MTACIQKVEPVYDENGKVIEPEEDAEPEYEIPFNLATLRKHLANVTLARRVLSDDAVARQKLLEESVYDVAVERLKHQAELFDQLGLNDKGLKSEDLRAWMWNWHLNLQHRIKAEMKVLAEAEERYHSEYPLPAQVA